MSDEMFMHRRKFTREAMRILLDSGVPRARVAAYRRVGKSTPGKCLADYPPAEMVSALQGNPILGNRRRRGIERLILQETVLLHATNSSGLSISALNACINCAPSAPSMARWSKLPVADMMVAICKLSSMT